MKQDGNKTFDSVNALKDCAPYIRIYDTLPVPGLQLKDGLR